MVVDVDEWGIDVQDKDGTRRRIEAVTKVWAAGVQASPLGKMLAEQTGAPLDRAGRIGVNPDLTLPGHPEVFVVGDMISLDHLPGVAQVAIQGAKYAAKEIKAPAVDGKAPQRPFKYFDKGSMATISRFRAVALVGKLRLTGFIAWLMWLAVHLVYMTGFKNRVSALLHWCGQLPRPRPLGADRHRAADLRPRGAAAAQGRRRRPGQQPRRLRGDPERCSRPPAGPSSRRGPPRRPGSPTPASGASTTRRPPRASADPARQPRLDDVDGGLLGARAGAVDADVLADQVLLHVGPEALVLVDQPAGALGADLAADVLASRLAASA